MNNSSPDINLCRQAFLGGIGGLTMAIAAGLFALLVSPNRLPPLVYPLSAGVGAATGAVLAIETKYGRGKRRLTAWKSNPPDYEAAVESTANDFLEDVIAAVYDRRAIAGFPKDLPAIAPIESISEPEPELLQTPEPLPQTHENYSPTTPAMPPIQFANVLPLDRGDQSAKTPAPEIPKIPSNIFSGASEGLSIVGSSGGGGSDDDAWGDEQYASSHQHR